MNRISGTLMALVISAGLMAERSSAIEPDQPQRLSLAISGGASKGAYEAGINWAILKLFREARDLKTLSGGRFRELEVASVAGASAGGVNTILTGLTWCACSVTSGSGWISTPSCPPRPTRKHTCPMTPCFHAETISTPPGIFATAGISRSFAMTAKFPWASP